MDLYTILRNTYDKPSNQKHALDKFGYAYYSNLSSNKFQTYFNYKSKTLLFTVKGTNVKSFSDLKTDVSLALGRLKNTKRYKDAKNGLEKARETLKPSHTIVAGHSMGGAIASYIARKTDKVYTLDKGATIGQKTRSNETAYRVKGDAASAAISGSKNVTTLDKTNNSVLDYLVPFASTISSHNTSQIKDSGIVVDKGEPDYKVIDTNSNNNVSMPYA
jgi:hypothetical protein